MRKLLLAGVAIAALCGVAASQVNVTPQFGLTSGYYAKNTYSSAFFGLVPPASATDELCIAGSATKVIRIDRIVIGGTATTLVSLPVTVVRRAALDTGGTAALTTANPGITTQIASRDTGQSPNTAPVATLVSYTAVPTINDTAPVYLDSALMTLNTTAAASNPQMTIFDWSRDIENNVQVPTLRGAAQQICVNFNAVSITAGALNGSITWTEE
jgi:hypothetical protein